ncbi:hypothetical protein [Halorubrum trueperi]|uniref:CopG family transcriptional regulator n=1 Tax=Halorubrum trueperi TaxID=2004704 RepID=A0ABD5UE92_9EURY
MSDSWEADESVPVDVDTFQEWLRYTADSRDVDEQELLNRLVSAYWVLDEMSDVVPDAGTRGSGSRPPDRNPIDGVPDWSPPASEHRRSADEPDAGSADGRTETERPTNERPPNEQRPNEQPTNERASGDGDDESSSADGSSTEDAVADEIAELRNSVHTQISLVHTVAELRRQVSDLSLDVEQQRSRQDGFTDRIADDVTRLHERIERIETQSGGDTAELERRVADVEETLDEIESTHGELETWVDGEFDEIESLFERLIEKTDRLDDRLGDVDPIVESVADRDRNRRELAALRRQAFRLDVSGGNCESCGAYVDFSLLTDPACPGCERTFTDIEPDDSWNPFSKPTLRTDADQRNSPGPRGPIDPRDSTDKR